MKIAQDCVAEQILWSFSISRGLGLQLPSLSTSLARKSRNWKWREVDAGEHRWAGGYFISNFARIRFTIAMLEYKPGKEVAKLEMNEIVMQDARGNRRDKRTYGWSWRFSLSRILLSLRSAKSAPRKARSLAVRNTRSQCFILWKP